MSVATLLSRAVALHSSLEHTKRLYSNRFAPDFNYCDFIDFDELKISRVIAWLLNPKESHGQGAVFLKLFLERLQLDWPLESLSRAQVILEAPAYAEKRRRIDLLVKCDERAIGIENKLWGAGDQIDQVLDYLYHLDREAPRDKKRCLIYLTSTGAEPSPESLSAVHFSSRTKSRQLRLWSYRDDIVVWLRECRAYSKAQRISTFIAELSEYLSRKIGANDMAEASQIVSEVVKSPENVRAAFAILNASDEMKINLLEKFHAALDAACRSADWNLLWDLSPKKETGFSIDFGLNYLSNFRVQFEGPNYKWLIYGLIGKDVKAKPDSRVQAQISSYLGQQSERGDWWHWYRRAGDRNFALDLDWSTNPEPWVAIANDGNTLVALIMEAAKNFKNALDGEDRV